MQRNSLFTIALAISVTLLTGCAGGPLLSQGGNSDIYARSQSMQVSQVVEGTILQVRDITISSGSTAKGIGAASGGILGAAMTRKKSSGAQLLASIAGAGGGALIASAVGQTRGDEIVVRLNTNEHRSIVQEKSATSFRPGQKVLVIITGMEARVVPKS